MQRSASRTGTDRSLLRRLARPVLAFVGLVAAGVIGFVTLGGIGVVNALFWLLDPTSIELHFRTHDGPATLVKGYAIVVLTGLVVAGLWTGETVLSAAFGGQIQDELTRMQIAQRIGELDDHVVVCGYGTFGQTVAAQIADTDTRVVVIEQQTEQYERALDDGHLALEADASREETLTEAGVKRADTVIGAIDDTNANIQIAVLASQLAPTVRLIVRAGDRQDETVARRVGADEVIIPEVVSGKQVCERL
ncbi:NAD-binding protein [Haloarcula sp. S1AR25-5A]|uniref:NAD-binding protein n=1 Tax=Haloarcula terrestris TaxID=2950533 RepID=A0AAE4EV76_9EURY|nr:NAD-binding protein [Haloarcula terrestris]MDS0220089.1 NAD-binding protein [Haloarcula terrestris]